MFVDVSDLEKFLTKAFLNEYWEQINTQCNEIYGFSFAQKECYQVHHISTPANDMFVINLFNPIWFTKDTPQIIRDNKYINDIFENLQNEIVIKVQNFILNNFCANLQEGEDETKIIDKDNPDRVIFYSLSSWINYNWSFSDDGTTIYFQIADMW